MPTKNNHLEQIAHQISFYPQKRIENFLELSLRQRAEVVLQLTSRVQRDLVTRIPRTELIKTLEYLDPDEATDVIQSLPEKEQSEVVQDLSEKLKQDVQILSGFDEQTAGGLMDRDYIQVRIDDTVGEVAEQVKLHERRTGRMPVILAVQEGEVIGYLPGHILGLTKPTARVRLHTQGIRTVRSDANHDEVLKVFRDHPHDKVVVIGSDENVVGIIYSDDVLKALGDQQAASLYKFAGVHREESVLDTTAAKVQSRYRWLILNLFTTLVAAAIINLFKDTVSKYVLLAVYMPIVAGMGGNAGTQTLAVLVRGIALKQVEPGNAWLTLKREMGAGLIDGLITGVVIVVMVSVLSRDILIALILGMAMVVNLVVAGTFGTLVPLVLQRLGKDPATSASIFITTATDVLGFLTFLGLASLLLP